MREGALFLILPVFGVPLEVGIYAGLISRARELFWIGVGLLWGHLPTASFASPPVASEA